MADLKGWTERKSKSTGKTYYFCESDNKTVWTLPAETCGPKDGASAPTSASTPSAAKGTLNVTVQTPSGPKSFTVTAKGGKYRKTRKNKYKKKKSRKSRRT